MSNSIPCKGQTWKGNLSGAVVIVTQVNSYGVSYSRADGTPCGTRSMSGFTKNFSPIQPSENHEA